MVRRWIADRRAAARPIDTVEARAYERRAQALAHDDALGRSTEPRREADAGADTDTPTDAGSPTPVDPAIEAAARRARHEAERAREAEEAEQTVLRDTATFFDRHGRSVDDDD